MAPPRIDEHRAESATVPRAVPDLRFPRTRVLRGCNGGVAWELWLRAPAPEFGGLIAGLWAGDGDSDFARHRLIPDGELWLMFNLGPPQRVIGTDAAGPGEVFRAGMIAGLHDGSVTFESLGRHPRVVSVRFLPFGALAFFGGLPLFDLSNRVLDLESVLGGKARAEPLRQRLIEAPDLGSALDLVEQWVTARVRAGPRAHPATRMAVDSLRMGRGAVRIEELACDPGVSSRYLNVLFQREVGLPAKGLVRVLRLGHALDLLDAGAANDLARLAQKCGYYDQSHLNRDFRSLLDLTPVEYVGRVFRAPGWREISG
jgi:AraC-like DNA-binding protein